MADAPHPPDGYTAETRTVYRKKNSDFSESRKHEGLKSGLARDRETSGLSHVLIGDRIEPEPAPESSESSYADDEYDWDGEGTDEGVPDISQLIPLALVAAAGIAAGVAGVNIARNRKRRRQQEPLSVVASSAAPAGWYAVASDPTRLRRWDGTAWTNEYAQRAGTAPAIAADWYPDPSNGAQLRYWDGTAWTVHVSAPPAATTPADWYPDPSNAAQLRYWDGTAWSQHVTSGTGASVGSWHAAPAYGGASSAPAHQEPRIQMSGAEWRAHVEAWVQAGVIQQELWRRLSNAQLTDADDAALAARRQWEELTPQEGARRIEMMLEADPSLRNQAVLVEFVNLFRPRLAAPMSLGGDAPR